MIGYLIDPYERTVTKVEYDGSLDAIYSLLKVDCIDMAHLTPRNGDVIAVDDNGLINGTQHFFAVRGYHQPLAGRGLVMGTRADGESCSPQRTIEQLGLHFPVLFMMESPDA